MEHRTIINQNTFLKCARLFTRYFSSQLLSPLAALVPNRIRCFIPMTIAPAFKDLHAGTLALVKSCTATINRRVVAGLLIMLIGTPLAYTIYTYFDRGVKVSGWYHVNFWHLFFLIRFQVSQIVFFLGLYIYMMESHKIKILALYHGFVLMAITQNIFADSNDDIWQGMNWYLFSSFAVLSLSFYFLLDWLVKRKFHGEDRFAARVKGLYQIAFAVPAEEFREKMVETLKGKYELQNS